MKMSRRDTLLSDQTPWPVRTFWRGTARLSVARMFLSRQKREATAGLAIG